MHRNASREHEAAPEHALTGALTAFGQLWLKRPASYFADKYAPFMASSLVFSL